jgi:hypothetical protein
MLSYNPELYGDFRPGSNEDIKGNPFYVFQARK